MKKIHFNTIKLITVICLSAFIISCDFGLLDEEPKTFLSENAVFANKDGVVAATISIYEPWRQENLYGWWLLGCNELFSDYLYGRGSQAPLGNYKLDATSIMRVGNIWRGCYSIINRTNVVIDQLEEKDIPGVDVTLKNQLLGEARFNRALSYFHLVRLFGDVPLRTESVTDPAQFAIPRTPAAQVYEQIIEDLEFAESNLPPVYPANELGRATKWAATSLLSKVYLTQENWTEAASKAKSVMDSGLFSLVEVKVPEDFQKIFGPDITTHSEEIFSIRHSRIPGLGFNALWVMHRAGSGYSLGNNAHAWYGNFDSWLGEWVKELNSPDPDLRTKDWLYNGPHDEKFLDGTIKMLFKKFRDTESDVPGNDFPVIRYTEVVLIYAEAISQAGNGPTTDAYEAVNMVRRRAFGRDLHTPVAKIDLQPGLSAAEFQDEILLERAKEFVMEGKRWYDLLRTGKAIEVISAAGPVKSAIQEKHLKWPIPSEEIDNNDALNQEDQNPGW